MNRDGTFGVRTGLSSATHQPDNESVQAQSIAFGAAPAFDASSKQSANRRQKENKTREVFRKQHQFIQKYCEPLIEKGYTIDVLITLDNNGIRELCDKYVQRLYHSRFISFIQSLKKETKPIEVF